VAYAPVTESLTFLFTDIEGSTALLRRVGANAYAELLAIHQNIIRGALKTYAGREVNSVGDCIFAVFASTRAAAICTVAVQQELESHPWPPDSRIRVRMGIHAGEATETSAGLVGFDVHRAARVAAVGSGGQILVSETAEAVLHDALPADAILRDLGLHRLKDLSGPEHLFQLYGPGLQADFPPLRSLDNPALRHNLPQQPSSFVGRTQELSHARGLVDSSRLVTLTGAGGSGKTRLALQVAAELLDGSGDGVWLVELAPISDEHEVVPTIAQTLGITAQPGRPALETLVEALRTQATLIVLDNCEHLIGTCAKAADALVRRCTRVHILVTSREPLGITGETVYRLPPMSLPRDDAETVRASDAVELFIDRARAQGVTLEVDARTGPLLASVCRRLDGMPLAIELAAARLRSVSLEGIHARLDQRFRLLTGGSRSALARQRTLEATVDWSYSFLNPVEQCLLRRLSIFVEDYSLEAAEQVCGLGDIEVFDIAEVLGSLVDKSLVQTEPSGPTTRYRLLETIRQFAAERLTGQDEGGGRAVADAHCLYFLALAEEASPHLKGPEQIEWSRRLDVDNANLRRAIEHADAREDGTELILRFAVALRRYWSIRDRHSEGLAVLRRALDDPSSAADRRLRGCAMVTAALLARGPDLQDAAVWSERALDIANEIGDERLRIEALGIRTSVAYLTGDTQRGLRMGEEAVARARTLGDDSLIGETLITHLLCVDELEPAHADALFAEALGATERSGDLFIRTIVLNNAAVHALRIDNLSAARRYLENGVALTDEMGRAESRLGLNLGWVMRQDADPQGARSHFQAALRVARLQGDREGIACAAAGLACVDADGGFWEQASTLFGIADALYETAGARWEDPESSYRRGSIERIVEHIGAETFEKQHHTGQALSVEDAIDYCVGLA
jgi:predicted ATPase/class 3 adenylate cyclase